MGALKCFVINKIKGALVFALEFVQTHFLLGILNQTLGLCVVYFAVNCKEKCLQMASQMLKTKGINLKNMKGVTKLIFGVLIGGLYGMLFAQKPGKKLRAELVSSQNPLKTLFNEGKKVDLEARDTLVTWAKNSEELQKIMASGKDQFNAVVAAGKEMGEDARTQAQKKLEEVASNATKAAQELKAVANKKITSAKKSATKQVKKAKKIASKKIEKTAKIVNKKAIAAHKAVRKTVKKVSE